VISGVYCGIAGSLFAFLSSYISATSFIFPQSVLYLVMLMLGGYNSITGPIIGTTLLVLLPEWFRPLQEYILLVYGLGVILLMVVMPDGLTGGGKKIYEYIANEAAAPDQEKNKPVMVLDKLCKRFGGVVAADEVSFSLIPVGCMD